MLEAITAMASVIGDPYLLMLIAVTTVLGIVIGVLPGPTAVPEARQVQPLTTARPPNPEVHVSIGIPRISIGIPRISTGIPRISMGIPRISIGIPRERGRRPWDLRRNHDSRDS